MDAVVVAPHPDDEVLGASGILTTRQCLVVFASDGVPPDADPARAADLAATRLAEAHAAHASLRANVDGVVQLPFADQRLTEHVQELAAALAEVLADNPSADVYVPAYQRGHPDHDAVYVAAQLARAQLAEAGADAPRRWFAYALYGLDDDGRPRFGRLAAPYYTGTDAVAHRDDPASLERKVRALREFVSQRPDESVLEGWLRDPVPEQYARLPDLATPLPTPRCFYEEVFHFSQFGIDPDTMTTLLDAALDDTPRDRPVNPTPEYEETEHKERLRAGLVVTIAVVFNAVMLWPETQAVHRLSDQPAHVAWVRWAADRILDGHSPLDGWLPQLALGAPHFHQYEVLPHIVGGFFATVFDPATVVNWSTYLLVASWPVAVYAGARLLDRDRRVATIAAVLAPLLASTTGFGFEWSSYTFTGSGLWAQVFGMWLLPLTMGFTWRAIDRGRGFAIAAVLLAATLCSHFVWGYVGFIWLGIVVVAGSRAFGRRLWRGALVAGGALLASAWLLVPLAVDASWIGEFQHRNRTEFDSYGARSVLEWLVTGKLLDFGRPYAPVITVVAFVGVGVCVARFRRDVPARLILLFTAVGLVLYFGRPTLGPVVDWIPGLHEIPLHRFVAVVQMGALLLAGIGGSWLIGATIRVLQRVEPNRRAALTLAASVVGILVLVPAVTERGRFAEHDDYAINAQRVSERYEGAAFADLVAFATRRGGGRISAGNVTGAGVTFGVGQVPSYAEVLNDDGLGIGFAGRVASLSVDTELAFNVTDPDQFPIYGVHYIILPSVGTPVVPATLLRTRGPYSLFEVGPPGYLRVADVLGPPIVANRATLGAGTTAYLGSNLARFGATRPIAFDGAAAMHPTARELEPTTAGAVQREVDHPDDGEYRGTVHMQRRGAVVLAASYHPRWTVTVDGKPQQPEMVAPSFVAVVVPPGVHRVVFSYQPYPGTSYALLFMVGIAAIGALLVIDRRQVDRRAPRNLPRIVTRATAPDSAP